MARVESRDWVEIHIGDLRVVDGHAIERILERGGE